MILSLVRKIINENSIDSIKLSGITSIENGIAEFIPDMRYMYFEFGDHLIEFQSVDQYSRLKVRVIESIIHDPDFEDVIPSYTNISWTVFVNHLAINKVSSMTIINAENSKSEIVCDAIELILGNGQILFLDPQFIGINIGGQEQKLLWLKRLTTGKVINETVIRFD